MSCSVAGCEKASFARGWCPMHYRRWWKHGDTAKTVKASGPVNGHFKHGMTRSRTYRSWLAMKSRCLNPNVAYYKHYGGRGITICERWRDFANFLADMGERPEGRTLDRIDNDGNYEPSNCRWATPSEQRRNQRVAVST